MTGNVSQLFTGALFYQQRVLRRWLSTGMRLRWYTRFWRWRNVDWRIATAFIVRAHYCAIESHGFRCGRYGGCRRFNKFFWNKLIYSLWCIREWNLMNVICNNHWWNHGGNRSDHSSSTGKLKRRIFTQQNGSKLICKVQIDLLIAQTNLNFCYHIVEG